MIPDEAGAGDVSGVTAETLRIVLGAILWRAERRAERGHYMTTAGSVKKT